jgi:TolC family type I secretion outer membrane protein
MAGRSSAVLRRFPARVLTAVVGLGLVMMSSPAPAEAPPPAVAAPPAPGQVLSLPEAVALALRQNPTITSAQQLEAAARARIGEARAGFLPRFDWLTSAGRSQVFSTTLNRPITGNSISTAIQGSQLIYDFGKVGATVDQARANARFSGAEVERVQQVVVQNVKLGYFNLLQARRLVGVAEAAVSRAELNLRSARGFFDVGTKPKSDVTKAEVEVANAQVALIRARNLVRTTEAALANALGLEATTPLQIQDILTYEPVTLDPKALLAEALANRPELAEARAQIDAAQAQLAGARANYLPTINVSGSYGGASTDPELHETWSIVGTLSWNLFQGFFTTYQVRETEALVGAARATYANQELLVRLDVEQAYVSVVEAAERIVATGVAVESARENLSLAQGRYDAGVGTILELTDAQLALTNAEADQVRALTDYRNGLATLDRVVGRR